MFVLDKHDDDTSKFDTSGMKEPELLTLKQKVLLPPLVSPILLSVWEKSGELSL